MAVTKKIPLRKCVGCMQLKEKPDLIRLLKEEETGMVVADPTGRRNGRGCYLCRSAECLELALKNHGIERSLKCSLKAENPDLLKKELMLLGK